MGIVMGTFVGVVVGTQEGSLLDGELVGRPVKVVGTFVGTLDGDDELG